MCDLCRLLLTLVLGQIAHWNLHVIPGKDRQPDSEWEIWDPSSPLIAIFQSLAMDYGIKLLTVWLEGALEVTIHFWRENIWPHSSTIVSIILHHDLKPVRHQLSQTFPILPLLNKELKRTRWSCYYPLWHFVLMKGLNYSLKCFGGIF